MRWLALAVALAACAPLAGYRDTSVTIASAAAFDPARYAGTWYEVASYPVPFQEGCAGTQATYTPRADGTIGVRNLCFRNGAWQGIEGTARVVGPGRLRVRLDGVPFRADYWVLWVAEDYGTAVVGTPDGRAGWVLNRTPDIRPDRLAAAREVLEFNGYDLAALRLAPRP